MMTKKRLLPIFVAVLMVFAWLPTTVGQVYAADEQTEISYIYVGITHPTAGDSFANTSNVRVSGDGFKVKRIEWCEDYGYDDDGNIIGKEDSDHQGEHGIFNPKFSYYLIVELTAENGYIFPSQNISNPDMLSSAIIRTYNGSITGARKLSDSGKTAVVVLCGIHAYTSINISRPKTGEETTPTVSLPEFENSWYELTSTEWCDANGENAVETKTFNEGETAYAIAHLKSRDSKYNWYSTPDILVNGGSFIKTIYTASYEKLDVMMSVPVAASRESLGDITIDLSGEGTSLTGNELEAVLQSLSKLGEADVIVAKMQTYDIDKDNTPDVFVDNMSTEEGYFSRFYASSMCSFTGDYSLAISEDIKASLLADGYAYCDNIIFKYDGSNAMVCPAGGEHQWGIVNHKGSFDKEGYQEAICTKCGQSSGGAVGVIPAATAKLAKTSYVYTGKAIKPSVSLDSSIGPLNENFYTITYSNNAKAGTATVKITLKGDFYEGSKSLTFKITKAANPLTIKAKTATVKYSKLKKKAQTLAVTKVIKFTKKLNDKKIYTLVSAKKGSKSFKKYFKINKTTGNVTVKKGLKKGTYKVKVKVKAAGNSNYKGSAVKTVTFKVKVK